MPTSSDVDSHAQALPAERASNALRQAYRNSQELGLASMLVGGRRRASVKLNRRFVLVDTASGEILDAPPGEAIEERFALLHSLSAEPSNHWTGEGRDHAGRAYDAAGSLWRPPSRLSPNTMEARRRHSRRSAREGVARLERTITLGERFMMEKGYRGRFAWTFLTLTQPRISGEADWASIQRGNRAFDLFRKREAFKSRVRGGPKGLEAPLDCNGAHAHLHLLLLMRYWDWKALREEWRSCVDQAMKESIGSGLSEEASVMVDIRLVRSRGRLRDGEILLEDAVQEVCKYVTKTENFVTVRPDGSVEGLAPERILALENIARWPRMFELLGKARASKKLPVREADGFLDTASIFDGKGKAPHDPVIAIHAHGGDDEGAESVDPDPPRPQARARPPSLRALMQTLSLSDWLQVAMARVEVGRRMALQRVRSKFESVQLLSERGALHRNTEYLQ